MKIYPGNYVLIQATAEGSRYPAEIIRVIDHEDEKFYRMHNLWPTSYDIEGFVERLAEKVIKAEAAAEVEREEQRKAEEKALKKKQKKEKLTNVLNSTSSMLCAKYMKLMESIRDKMVSYSKEGTDNTLPGCEPGAPTDNCNPNKKPPNQKSPIPDFSQKPCKSDKDCLADAPLFPDMDFPVHCVDVPKSVAAHSSTNTRSDCVTTASTPLTETKSFKIGRCISGISTATASGSGCCSKSCGGKSLSRQSTGSGPCYSNLTVGRDQLPPLYGKCTPWRVSKKELKKKCEEYNDTLFTAINKEPCNPPE